MNKEIICVYQDCPLCGDKGKKLKKLIIDKQLNVRKVSFASTEGKDLCNKAVFGFGIKTMPFFTDGEKFVNEIDDLLEDPKKIAIKPKKKAKRATKKKGVNDEPNI